MQISGFINENTPDSFKSFIPLNNSGSTSDTYIVTQGGKQLFMKRLKDELLNDLSYRELFRKEFEKGSSICHPNIVKYEQLEDTFDECYILMENIAGETLNEFIESHPDYFKSRGNLDKFFNQLLSALKCLHENHVVYSDLKPQNIMVTQVNNDVKLIDLGFCFTDSYTNSAGTTKGFSAPEHILNDKLDITTDIFGIGKIIEYIGKNSAHNLPGIYAKIMLRCLKERKQDRIQSTDEIIKLINKRKHYIRRTVFSALTFIVLFVAIKSLSYNQHVLAWWDSFELFPRHVEYDAKYRHVYYRILSEADGTCAAVGCGTNPNLYIHSKVDINGKRYRVTHIADSAFKQKMYLKSVHIPEGITTIGMEAFRECKNIATIYLPNSVTKIEDYAFYACEHVYNLRLPPAITEIPIASFCGNQIRKAEIPEGVTTIKLDAFGNCEKLEEIILPSTLKRLERGIFWNCSSLESITIPSEVAYIGDYLFFECVKLKNIFNLSTEPQNIPPIHRNPAQITLHVPAGSVEKYRNADYWKDMNIVPIEN